MEKLSKDLTAALVDNEIQDESLRKQLISQLETDSDLRYEYMVQNLIKNLIKEKVRFQETPVKVRQNIIKKIQPDEIKSGSRLPFLSELFTKPAFTFATAIIVVVAIILIIMNRPEIVEPNDFALKQLGKDNMFIQAQNNFQSIVEGKLTPQITSSDPEEIKNFFASSGVKYSTLVPEMPKWNLIGAVVSEDQGEKFAHHVYANDEGEIVYLFQIDESYLQSHEIIKLSDDLLSYIEQGNCYKTISNNHSTLMAKAENNIYAVVSNASLEDISNYFCGIN